MPRKSLPRKALAEAPSLARLAAGLFGLALDSQRVIALRMMKMALGGAGAKREAKRMVREKFDALRDAGASAMIAAATGRADKAPAKALALYRRRVKANARRLSP